MKALSIRQPYAAAILAGLKTIEYRSWQCAYRGPLLIHAGKRKPTADDDCWGDQLPDVGTLPRGCIIGVVDLVDITRDELDGPDGPIVEYHWHLSNPRTFATPIEMAGRLNLFEVPDAAISGVIG